MSVVTSDLPELSKSAAVRSICNPVDFWGRPAQSRPRRSPLQTRPGAACGSSQSDQKRPSPPSVLDNPRRYNSDAGFVTACADCCNKGQGKTTQGCTLAQTKARYRWRPSAPQKEPAPRCV